MRFWMLFGCVCWTLFAYASSPTNGLANHNPSVTDIPRKKAATTPVASPSLVDWQKANAYFKNKQFIQALARVEKHLMEHPGDCNAQYLKVQILMDLGEQERAKLIAQVLLYETQLLYTDWLPYLHHVVEQAQPPVRWEEAAHYPPFILPWEA